MEAAGFFEVPVPLSQNTQYHIPEVYIVDSDSVCQGSVLN